MAGLGFAGVGAFWPAPRLKGPARGTALDEFLPEYHFHEIHSLEVHASPEWVFRAIHEVRPEEIRWLGTLMTIRQLPEKLLASGRPPEVVPGYRLRTLGRKAEATRRFRTQSPAPGEVRVTGKLLEADYEKEGSAKEWTPARILGAYRDALASIGGEEVSREDCCRATFHLERGSRDLWVEVATDRAGRSFHLSSVDRESATARKETMLQWLLNSGFLFLREIKDREVVFGVVNRMVAVESRRPPVKPEEFASFSEPGVVKIAANFRVEGQRGGWSRVTTETRILATDEVAERRFGAYWRLIHPGSALIRRSWLQAIRRRAEEPMPASGGGDR